MSNDTLALAVGIGIVVLAFFLKIGLFNTIPPASNRIRTLNAAAEFPIDGTSAIVPLVIALSYTHYSKHPWLMIAPILFIIIIVVQILFFKNIKFRNSNTDTKHDLIFNTLMYFISYLFLLLTIAFTYSLSQEIWP